MGFGAIITSGPQNELLGSDLMDCITEVRVEQTLDEPTVFALRFQEDIRDGEPMVMGAEAVQPERLVSIAVPVPDGLACLVRGPITDVRCSVTLGGPGSWVQFEGRDRRVEMDRQCFRHPWEGRASEVAESILRTYDFETDIARTTRVYSEATGTLNQRATDLAFLRRIARQNNLDFWLTYACETAGLAPGGGQLQVRETAHLKPSPERPAGGPAAPPSAGEIGLAPTREIRLRVNVDPSQCQNVTSFEMDMDVERPNQYEGSAVSDRDAREDRTTAEDPQPPVRRGGETLRGLAPARRQVCLAVAGDQEELQPRAEAVMTDSGWFIEARAETTGHMLGGVLVPHDIVEVEGLGRRHSGAYQVKSVTHVVNAADHHMEMTLRRNSVGEELAVCECADEMYEATEARYLGKYRGLVVDNEDPTHRGRLKVRVPAVMGEEEIWALPCVPYAGPQLGLFTLPELDTGVWVEFEAGDPSYPIWVGCFWGDGDIPSSDAVPDIKFLRTKKLTLRIDDTVGELLIENDSGSVFKLTPQEISQEATSIKTQSGSKKTALTAAHFDVHDGAFRVV